MLSSMSSVMVLGRWVSAEAWKRQKTPVAKGKKKNNKRYGEEEKMTSKH